MSIATIEISMHIGDLTSLSVHLGGRLENVGSGLKGALDSDAKATGVAVSIAAARVRF